MQDEHFGINVVEFMASPIPDSFVFPGSPFIDMAGRWIDINRPRLCWTSDGYSRPAQQSKDR